MDAGMSAARWSSPLGKLALAALAAKADPGVKVICATRDHADMLESVGVPPAQILVAGSERARNGANVMFCDGSVGPT